MTAAALPDSRPPLPQRWRQFSLRSLMALMLACCVGLALWTVYVEPYRRQQRLAARIVELKGDVSTEAVATSWSSLFGEAFFVNIVRIRAGQMPVDDAWMVNLRDTPKLRELTLPNKNIGDAGLAYVVPLENLQGLSIRGTKISSAGLTSLQKLHRLEWLHASRTQSSDSSLASLAGLRQLKELHLAGCPITDAGLVHLEHLTNLEALDLRDTRVTDEGVFRLANLRKLSTLQLDNTQITEASLARLKRLPLLTNVSVAGSHTLPSALREAFPAMDERMVRKALAEPTVIEFVQTPLVDVVDYLKDYHKIEIQLDRRDLKEAGIIKKVTTNRGTIYDFSEPITQNLGGPLEPALITMLDPVGLKHVLCYGVLMITTKENRDAGRPRLVVKPGEKVSRQLSAALFRSTPFEFVETPLSDVLAYPSHFGITIQFADASDAEQLASRPVTHNSRLAAGTGLELLFHELDLHGVIEGDTIFVDRGPVP